MQVPIYDPGFHQPSDIPVMLPFELMHDLRRPAPPGLFVLSGRSLAPRWEAAFKPMGDNALILPLTGYTTLKGKLTRTFNSFIGPGDVVTVPCGTPFEYQAQGINEQLIFFYTSELIVRVGQDVTPLDPSRFELVERVAFADPLLLVLGRAILQTLQTGGVAANIFLESLTHTMVVHLLRSYAVFPARAESLPLMPHPVAVHLAREYIHAHPQQQLSLSELAGVANVSPYHLTRLFKQHTGQSVHQYVLAHRLDIGRRMVGSSEFTIAHIADLLGFADHSHFIRHFKRRFGVTPNQLRKSAR